MESVKHPPRADKKTTRGRPPAPRGPWQKQNPDATPQGFATASGPATRASKRNTSKLCITHCVDGLSNCDKRKKKMAGLLCNGRCFFVKIAKDNRATATPRTTQAKSILLSFPKTRSRIPHSPTLCEKIKSHKETRCPHLTLFNFVLSPSRKILPRQAAKNKCVSLL